MCVCVCVCVCVCARARARARERERERERERKSVFSEGERRNLGKKQRKEEDGEQRALWDVFPRPQLRTKAHAYRDRTTSKS